MEGKTEEEIQALLDEEKLYKTLLTQMQGQTDGDWYVRYIKDSTTGINTPYFYNDLDNANYVENYANVNCFTIGSTTKTKEVLNQPGKVEKILLVDTFQLYCIKLTIMEKFYLTNIQLIH